MIFLFIIAIILLVSYLLKQLEKPSNFPPGPSFLPIVGNLPELKRLSKSLGGQHLALYHLSKQYKTNVLGLKLGKDFVITVFSYDTIRKVLLGAEYEGRPDNFFLRLRCMGTKRGVTCLDGEPWQIQRNFVVRHLRNLGFGKRPMDLLVRDEIAELLPLLNQRQSLQVGVLLAPAVINIIWALTTGARIARDDDQLNRLLDVLELRSKAFDMSGGAISQHPWLRFVAPERSGFNLIQRMNLELKRLFMKTINEHHRKWYEGRNDDLIYAFISEMKQAKETDTTFTNEQLVMVCLDLFIAGSQTTSNTLDFAILMMILHPNVQQKVQQQIDQCLDSTPIDYNDRKRVPYVEAVLLEVERYCYVVPVSGPRRVLQDTTLEGYSIPKEATVLLNMYSINFDPVYWQDPEVFRPERFINEMGELVNQDHVIAFGLGKRRCLGEALARTCIYTFFAEIIRTYSVELEPGSAMPTGVPLPGITLSPEKYKVKFTHR